MLTTQNIFLYSIEYCLHDYGTKKYVSRLKMLEANNDSIPDFLIGNNISDALLFKTEQSAKFFIKYLEDKFYIPYLKVGKVNNTTVLPLLNILNSVIPSEIKKNEAEAGKEYFVMKGSFNSFYSYLLKANKFSVLDRKVFTIRDCIDRKKSPLAYHYYPCDLFYEMNKEIVKN